MSYYVSQYSAVIELTQTVREKAKWSPQRRCSGGERERESGEREREMRHTLLLALPLVAGRLGCQSLHSRPQLFVQ